MTHFMSLRFVKSRKQLILKFHRKYPKNYLDVWKFESSHDVKFIKSTPFYKMFDKYQLLMNANSIYKYIETIIKMIKR